MTFSTFALRHAHIFASKRNIDYNISLFTARQIDKIGVQLHSLLRRPGLIDLTKFLCLFVPDSAEIFVHCEIRLASHHELELGGVFALDWGIRRFDFGEGRAS